jgi:hypothetical protein
MRLTQYKTSPSRIGYVRIEIMTFRGRVGQVRYHLLLRLNLIFLQYQPFSRTTAMPLFPPNCCPLFWTSLFFPRFWILAAFVLNACWNSFPFGFHRRLFTSLVASSHTSMESYNPTCGWCAALARDPISEFLARNSINSAESRGAVTINS